ncbi:MAG: hypothetical protein NTW86_03440 [Candidatus Sumerlaeota bacterium]|nr:hypothetical protein [Candidatus Sumerlaeota bacterium]
MCIQSLLCAVSDPTWKAAAERCAAEMGAGFAWAATPMETLAALAETEWSAALIDLKPLVDCGLDLTDALDRAPRRPTLAFVAGQEIESNSHWMRRHRVGIHLPRSHPPSVGELRFILDSAADPTKSLGLEKHLPQGTPVAREPLRTVADKKRLIEEISRRMEGGGPEAPSAFDVRLVFEEIVNNAILHAFSRPGRRLERLAQFDSLAPAEEILAQHSVGPRWVGLSVRDNQGRLTRDTVLERLHRQMSLSGLNDDNGRGLFLVRALASRLLISIIPGKVTEVTAIFDAQAKTREKMLCVFEAPRE